jgi:alpha-tubulin suppressor-like RCC1 family protein
MSRDPRRRAQVTFPLRCTLFGSPDLRIVSVACGHSHTLAIAETGTVWSCGRNGDGQLGNASFADSMQLKRVVGMK